MSESRFDEGAMQQADQLETMLELLLVRPESISAKARRIGPVHALSVNIGFDSAIVDDQVFLKCIIRCQLLSEEALQGEDIKEEWVLGDIDCDMVAAYAPTGELSVNKLAEVPQIALIAFADKYSLPDIFPYFREAITNMAWRLGYSNVSLGTLVLVDDLKLPSD